ncbi:MAG: STAS-like domain-containing protein [Lysobacter sp.]|nr:STAS-like domain-containing protein [Lysobacter sp.]
MRRVDGFRIAVLDFADVTRVGQALAGEVFRVFANEYPEIELQSIHATPEVQQIRRAEVACDVGNSAQLPLL